VSVLVRGRAVPPRIETITISADILQGGATANPLAAVTDIVLVFGATTVIFDPRLTPERRVQLLSDSMELALLTDMSEEDGLDARYGLSYDQAAGGVFVIVVTPRH